MKTYKELIIELNKFEAAMKAGKLSLKALKKVFANSKIGKFKSTTVSNPMANNMYKKMGLKKRIKPRYEVDTDDILKLRKQNKPGATFGEKDKFSKLAANRKSIHPPTADAAQTKIDDMRNTMMINKNVKRGSRAMKLNQLRLSDSAKRKGKSKGMD
mgnify:CR=1 FL=1